MWVFGTSLEANHRGRRGAALATALLLCTFLLIVGSAFLYLVQSDLRFQTLQERQERAYYLALAGFEYYTLHNYYDPIAGESPENPPVMPSGPLWVSETERIDLSLQERTVKGTPTMMVVSTGVVCNSAAQVLATRTLMAPKTGDKLEFRTDTDTQGVIYLNDSMGLDRGRRPVFYDESLQ